MNLILNFLDSPEELIGSTGLVRDAEDCGSTSSDPLLWKGGKLGRRTRKSSIVVLILFTIRHMAGEL